MIKKNFISITYLIITVFTLFTAAGQTDSQNQSFRDKELKLHNGKVTKLNQLKGKVVLLDFWYRGCFPCLQAVPELIKLQEEFKDDLVIVGINDKDIQEDVVDYFNYKKANYSSTYKTNDDISKNLEITGFPTIILFDKQGNLVQADAGYSKKGMNALRKAVKKAVKDK